MVKITDLNPPPLPLDGSEGVPVVQGDAMWLADLSDVTAAQVEKSQAWAEGTLPGGAGTKSAKEWAGDSAASAATAEAARDVSIASSVQYPTAAAAVAGLADGAFGSYLDGSGNPVWGQRVGASMVALPGPWIGADKIGSDDGASGTLWTSVKGFITYLRSSVGASIVGFVQDGVGAVLRSIMDKLREAPSATDYLTAAAGNDITAAMQAALNAHTDIILPRGNWVMGAVTIPNGRAVMAKKGATITRKSGVTAALFSSASVVQDFSFSGGAIDNQASAGEVFKFPNGSSDIEIERVRMTGINAGIPISFLSGSALSSDIKIRKNTFISDTPLTATQALIFYNPQRVDFEGNTLKGVGGISIVTSSALIGEANGLRVCQNDFKDCDNTNILIRTNGATKYRNVRVSKNTLENVSLTTGKTAITVAETGTPGGTFTNVTISKNTIRNFNGVGIKVGFVDILLGTNFTITGNTLSGWDGSTVNAETGIDVQANLNGVTISGNAVEYVNRAGIIVSGVSKNIAIAANTVNYAVQDSSPAYETYAGIYLFAGTNISINGNTVTNCGSAFTENSVIAGIGLRRATSITDVTISANTCTDDRATKYQVYGIRIGTTGANSLQPSYVTVSDNILRGNRLSPICWFASSNATPNFYIESNNQPTNVALSNAGALHDGTYTAGVSRIRATNPTAGAALEYVVTSSGSVGTLTGVTGDIASGATALTVNDASKFRPGQYIAIAGVTGTKRISSIAGNVVTIDSTASATVTGAAVTFAAPVTSTLTLN